MALALLLYFKTVQILRERHVFQRRQEPEEPPRQARQRHVGRVGRVSPRREQVLLFLHAHPSQVCFRCCCDKQRAADPRLFQRGGSSDTANREEDGFEFETAAKEEEDINVDDI